MGVSPVLSQIVLVVTAGVLFYAALTDLREFKIRNELILVLAGLFVVHALVSGRWVYAYWNVALAAVMFLVALFFYAQKWLGGGDVKILTVAFLWVGPGCALWFAMLMVIFTAIHVVAVKLGWLSAKTVGAGSRIPFAPSVAAALIMTFVLGCLQPRSLLTDLSGEWRTIVYCCSA
jgi:prepilin peptidase CpaA